MLRKFDRSCCIVIHLITIITFITYRCEPSLRVNLLRFHNLIVIVSLQCWMMKPQGSCLCITLKSKQTSYKESWLACVGVILIIFYLYKLLDGEDNVSHFKILRTCICCHDNQCNVTCVVYMMSKGRRNLKGKVSCCQRPWVLMYYISFLVDLGEKKKKEIR